MTTMGQSPKDRGGSDMDRAFEIALATLYFSPHHQAGARKFYADGLNNHAGHLTAYMAARVIDATLAALKAMQAEREAVTSYLLASAEAFSGVPVEVEPEERRFATAYSLDAVLRYRAMADHIKERAHLISDDGGDNG